MITHKVYNSEIRQKLINFFGWCKCHPLKARMLRTQSSLLDDERSADKFLDDIYVQQMK